MRLLNASTYELKEFYGSNIPVYAILSHTWEEEEILFSDLLHSSSRDTATRKKGWQKVLGTCKRAQEDAIEWVWIDTCCINKESSAELSEAINSMFRYYRDAFACYTYLSDYLILRDGYPDAEHGNASFGKCRWFTRGWTLQELLAPAVLIFFDAEWRDMGTKFGMKQAVSRVTRIPPDILVYGDFRSVSIAAKMSWAAERQTTRQEDRAYSLMGIFGVNIPPLYGEGGCRAFLRLQEEIMKYSNDQSIFAWSASFTNDTPWDSRQTHRGLLARSPSEFKASGDIRVSLYRNKFPYSLTNQGLHIQLPMQPVPDFPGQPQCDLYIAYLDCETKSRGERLGIFLRKVSNLEDIYERWHPDWLLTMPGSPLGHHIGICTLKEIYVEDFQDPVPHSQLRRPPIYSPNLSEIRSAVAKPKLAVLSTSKTISIDADGVEQRNAHISIPCADYEYYAKDRPILTEEPVEEQYSPISDWVVLSPGSKDLKYSSYATDCSVAKGKEESWLSIELGSQARTFRDAVSALFSGSS